MVRSICHTKCYWKETLWNPGEVYEGKEPVEPPADRWFSTDGKVDRPEPPPIPGLDPRSNDELRSTLKMHPFNFTAPKSWKRKQLWDKLTEFETAQARDAATAKDADNRAVCGFVSASKAGALAHERKCKKCQEILAGDEVIIEEEVEDGDSG